MSLEKVKPTHHSAGPAKFGQRCSWTHDCDMANLDNFTRLLKLPEGFICFGAVLTLVSLYLGELKR
jgi:hypothetical protein